MISSTDHRSRFILDILPAAILYTIFDFLWSDELLHAFLHSSNYIDSILFNYDGYHVNFKSILKRHFDLICHHIKPNQIKSLVLSDSNETPGQSKSFLSLFPIEQFIHLRAISLFEIENESHSLFLNLIQLKHLVSFETDTLSKIWMIEKLPRLKRLRISKYLDTDYAHENLLNSLSFSHLHNLTLPYCSYPQLREILHHAPKVISLNISLIVSDCTDIDYFAEQTRESSLTIRHLTMSIGTSTRTISRLLFERFLSRTPHLQELKLILRSGGNASLLEGNQWEFFIEEHLPFLSKFNFKFHLMPINREYHNEKNVLASFRSPFWLNRNPPWYVGYNINDLILYTIPHFVPHTVKHSSFAVPLDSITLAVQQYSLYHNQIKELELDANVKSVCRYTRIERLIVSISTIDGSVLDLSTVKYLCVLSPSWSWKKLSQIIRKSMIRLYHLEIQCGLSMTRSYDVVPLEQIRILKLPQSSDLPNIDKIDFSSVFPCVEYLTMSLTDIHQMTPLIDRLRHLSSASFHIINNPVTLDHILSESDVVCKWLRENSNRLARNKSFTCRVASRSDVWIHLWISNESIEPKKSSNTTSKDEQVTRYRQVDCQCGCSLQ